MRHRKNTATLSRTAAARRALVRSLAVALINRGRITTTRARSRVAQRYVERLVTVAKHQDLAARVVVIRPRVMSATASERTSARSRVAQRYVERLVTVAKHQDLAARRRLHGALGNRAAAARLLKRADEYRSRAGGYTRIIKDPFARRGDGAPRAILEFV